MHEVSDVDQKELTSISITPDVGMLSVLRHLNYKPWFALAEFVDNSLQSFLANQNQIQDTEKKPSVLLVKINISSNPDRIIISDNAAGIALKDFPRAFKSAHAPDDKNGLSEFGMGMKSAAFWFSKTWSVRTKALNESVERKVNFDIDSILSKNTEKLEVESFLSSKEKHFTTVILSNLHHKITHKTLVKIKSHLASIYRVFLRKGILKIIINNEEVQYEDSKVLMAHPYNSKSLQLKDSEAILWKKDILIDFGNGQKITGFAAIRETGSTKYAGFALFRRNRLIEGSLDDTYRPEQIFKNPNSYTFQRLFGELHIEGLDVSHTKDGFRWEEYEELILDALKDELSKGVNLLSQAEYYRSTPTKQDAHIEVCAEKAVSSLARELEKNLPKFISSAREAQESNSISQSLPEYKHLEKTYNTAEKILKVSEGNFDWIVKIRIGTDPADEDWLYIANTESQPESNGRITRRLTIDLNLAHAFSAKFIGVSNQNIEIFLVLAAAVSISLTITGDMGSMYPNFFLSHLNNFIQSILQLNPSKELENAN